MDRFDPKYEKISCELLEQLASEKLTFEEARLVVTLLEAKINRAGNDSLLTCGNDPHVVSQKAQEIETAVSAGQIRKEMNNVDWKIAPKDDTDRHALEIIALLAKKELPIWQAKEILQNAAAIIDNIVLK